MYIEEAMRTYALADTELAALIGTRWYGPTLEQFTTMPAVTVQCVSNGSAHSHEGYSGLEIARYQFTVFADTQLGLLPVIRRLERVLDGFRGGMAQVFVGRCWKAGRTDVGRDPGQKLYSAKLDFFVDYTVMD